MTDQKEVDTWFESEMPNAATQPLFDAAAKAGIALSIGYAELTPDGHHFNTQILTDKTGKIVGKYRKVHLPGHVEFDTERAVPASGKALFRTGRPRLPRVPRAGRHLRHDGVQRPPLAGILSRDGPAGRRDDRARLQHAVGEFAEGRSRGRSSACSTIACRCRPAPIKNSTFVVAVAKAGDRRRSSPDRRLS